MSLQASKTSLIHELFVRTADENYIAARWCAMNGLNVDFLWLAVHSIEKYLKGVLLMNGRSSRGYAHRILELYETVKSIAGNLLPGQLSKPAELNIDYWQSKSAEDFLSHLFSNGNADNRYLIYGYATQSQDLHMLDQMVFAIRRLICSLDSKAFIRDSSDQSASLPTNRDLLHRSLQYYSSLFMPLDKLINTTESSEKRTAALNLNMEFAPQGFAHVPIAQVFAANNPILLRRIFDPLERGDAAQAAEGIELARWALENIQIPRGQNSALGVYEQINEAIEAARIKHNI